MNPIFSFLFVISNDRFDTKHEKKVTYEGKIDYHLNWNRYWKVAKKGPNIVENGSRSIPEFQ